MKRKILHEIIFYDTLTDMKTDKDQNSTNNSKEKDVTLWQ